MSGVISDNTVRSSGQVAPISGATEDANDPARNTNPTEGVGTKWVNTTSGQIFLCTDATAGANIWVGQSGGSVQPKIIFVGGNTDAADEHDANDAVKVNAMSFRNPTTLGDLTTFGNLPETNQYFGGTSNGVSDRGIFAGGCTPATCPTNTISYLSCAALGNALDFGNLTAARSYPGACSNGTTDRGVFSGGGATGSDVKSDIIDYVTISSTGNATDQGNLVLNRDYCVAVSNGTNDRAINAAGRTNPAPPNPHSNAIDYWTISSGTNASTFGTLTNTRLAPGVCSNDTNERGLFMCGTYGGSYGDEIDYITISTTGNASDFGDMNGADPSGYPAANGARGHSTGTSNGTGERGVNGGGYTSISSTQSWYSQIQYVTISSTGNGQFFGDLPQRLYGPAACNNTFG